MVVFNIIRGEPYHKQGQAIDGNINYYMKIGRNG